MTKTKATSVADVTEGIVLARVEIAVPPERVFKALTTEELTAWWGADDMYRTTKFTIDLRPGGAWRTEGRGADGSDFHVEGEVLEVDPPRRLVQTWKPSWEPGAATTIVYTLDAIEGGTRVTVRHSGFT
ncbi:MAG TPA: SRPBCC domain-containing protein, partial [Kofleriaceae bacterium]|nr:SRPBCC domain-containing protein [Kofleriaceae bacterium]